MGIHVIDEEEERLIMIFLKPGEGRVVQVCGNAFPQISILGKKVIEREAVVNELIE